MKKFLKVVSNILVGALILVALITVLSVLGLPNQFRLFVVQSGSMSPAIPAGALVAVAPQEVYQVDDVITFKNEEEADVKNPKSLITHRIIDVKTYEDGTTYIITKGDANETVDGRETTENLVLGKVVLSVPYLGYPVGYAKTQTGFVILIVIPATLIAYTEAVNIKNETKKLLAERKKRKLTAKEKLEVAIGEEEIKVEKGFKKFWRKLGFKK